MPPHTEYRTVSPSSQPRGIVPEMETENMYDINYYPDSPLDKTHQKMHLCPNPRDYPKRASYESPAHLPAPACAKEHNAMLAEFIASGMPPQPGKMWMGKVKNSWE